MEDDGLDPNTVDYTKCALYERYGKQPDWEEFGAIEATTTTTTVTTLSPDTCKPDPCEMGACIDGDCFCVFGFQVMSNSASAQ